MPTPFTLHSVHCSSHAPCVAQVKMPDGRDAAAQRMLIRAEESDAWRSWLDAYAAEIDLLAPLERFEEALLLTAQARRLDLRPIPLISTFEEALLLTAQELGLTPSLAALAAQELGLRHVNYHRVDPSCDPTRLERYNWATPGALPHHAPGALLSPRTVCGAGEIRSRGRSRVPGG